MVSIPMTYLEWSVCFICFSFCLWKYGWKSSALSLKRTLKQVYRKIEAVFLTIEPQQVSTAYTSESIYYTNLPIASNAFNRRAKPAESSWEKCDTNHQDETPVFYRQMQPSPFDINNNEQAPCTKCTRCSKPSKEMTGEVLSGSHLKNCLDCDTREPHNPWYIRRFAFFVFFWRKWFIGPQYSMVSLKAMMGDEKLISAVKEAALQELSENPEAGSLNVLIRKHMQRAKRIVSNMRARQAKHPYFALFVRIASWIIGKTLGKIYPQILVCKRQIETIRKARKLGYPILYLPVHRSHIDYVLVSWTLVACDIRAPLVAAGENLNIPIFSTMMRSVGGFFIKRRLDRKEGKKDIVYRAILHSYMTRSLTDDNDLEFFIEGGRTRTGKPCLPKGGLLSIAMDALIQRKVEDILIVPVNFSYEKLLEGNYIREQLGQPKVSESFASAAMGLWNSIQTKFGNARVDFGYPVSMKEYIRSYEMQKSPSAFCISNKSVTEEDILISKNSESNRYKFGTQDQRELVNTIAKHVIYDGLKCFTLMSTSAISFILLNKYRTGVKGDKLEQEMLLMRKDLLRRGHDVGFSDKDIKETIGHGMAVLGPTLIRRERSGDLKLSDSLAQTNFIPVTLLPNIIDLSYYSTCVLPIYAIDAAIATSISVKTSTSFDILLQKGIKVEIRETDLLRTCMELCGILHHEFIFTPPCQTLETAIHHGLSDMVNEGLIVIESLNEMELNGDANAYDDSINRSCSSNVNIISLNLNQKTTERLNFFKNLLIPILDTYCASSQVLKRLIDCEAKEKQLQMEMLSEIKRQLEENELTFGESLALDPVRNFIKLLLQWQVLESNATNSVTMYNLTSQFDNESKVTEVMNRIRRFRIR